MGIFKQSLTTFAFLSTLPAFYDVTQKGIEKLELFQGVNFEFTDSLQTIETKLLFIFDDWCKDFWNSKAFDDAATAGRNRSVSTFYNGHNLFHQSKLGRDAEL